MSSLALLLLIVGLVWAREALADPPIDSRFSAHQPVFSIDLDLSIFGQLDEDSGNRLAAEGFRYQSLGLEPRYRASDQVTLRGQAVGAFINNALPPASVRSVPRALVTSSSADFLTLDSMISVDWASQNRDWLVTGSAFYHHQWAYIGFGGDLDVRRSLNAGNTVLRAGYSGRYADLRGKSWKDPAWVRDGPVDFRASHNLMLGWTQNLSPSLVVSAGLQYTRQDGLLHNRLQYVGLFDSAGQLTGLVDEQLPRTRNRAQLNLRGRYSPVVGLSLGLDLSGYVDDWDLLNLAVEPSVELPLAPWLRLRAWYRLSGQQQTRFFVGTIDKQAAAQLPFITQDSSLASFLMHSPGVTTLFLLPGTGEPRWTLRVSVLGFARSDRVFAVGASAGVGAEW